MLQLRLNTHLKLFLCSYHRTIQVLRQGVGGDLQYSGWGRVTRLKRAMPCLGHQLCGLALGGRTYKLKFGHHGGNHPVKDLETGRVEITAQNHGFAIDPRSIEKLGLVETHVNLNDGTSEGMRHRELPIFSVQYHPEASPGPHDAHYLFRRFADLMTKGG